MLWVRRCVYMKEGGVGGSALAGGAATAQELFEIFDEENRCVVEIRPRAQAHRLGLLHRSVNVVVTTPQRCVLLQRRSASKDVCPNRCVCVCVCFFMCKKYACICVCVCVCVSPCVGV